MKVFQLLDAILTGDAVSNDVLAIRRVLDGLGVDNEIYTLHTDLKLRNRRKDFFRIRNIRPEDVILFHYSGHSALVEKIRHVDCFKILKYHNITPPEFFGAFNREAGLHCLRGRDQVRGLARDFDLGVGDSAFNASELEAMGFPDTTVLPVIATAFEVPQAPPARRYDPGGEIRILFVGRLAPNKRQEDILKAFYLYRTWMNPRARLTLAGNRDHSPRYTRCLERLADDLGIAGAADLPGMVPDEVLERLFREAHVFLCLSEHEGFCVPLLEAMASGIPVVAFASSAVTETLGEGHPGLLTDKDPRVTARRIEAVVEDRDGYRSSILDVQAERLKSFSREDHAARLSAVLDRAAQTPIAPGC